MKLNEQQARRAALCDGIKLSLINNGVLALVLICFGAFINHKLEKLREHDSFMSEMNKIKAQKIGESWAELNEWEGRISLLYELHNSIADQVKNGIQVHQREQLEYSKLLNETYGYDKLFLIKRNRYYIDDVQYRLMEEFATLVIRKSDNYLTHNQDSIFIIDKLIEQKRVKIDEVANTMMGNSQKRMNKLP